MALYRLNPGNQVFDSWFFQTHWDVVTSSTTSIRLANSDGTFTILSGDHLTLNANNEPISGQVTSAIHLADDGTTVLERIDFVNIPLPTIFASYDDVFAFDPSLTQSFLSGNDIVIGSNNPVINGAFEYIFTGAGNDIAFGGGGVNLFEDSSGNDIYIGSQHVLPFPFVFDRVDYGLTPEALIIHMKGHPGSFGSTVVHVGTSEVDTLVNIDSVIGCDFGNTVIVDSNFINHDGTQNFSFLAGAGNDVVLGNGHTSVNYAGRSAMTIDLDAGTAHATDPADAPFRGFDTLSGVNTITGGRGHDTILGSNGSHAELFILSSGDDFIDGRGGNHDRFSFFNSSGRIVDLSHSEGSVLDASSGLHLATLLNIEDIEAGSGNDQITMSDANNLVFGNAGNDVIYGLAGNDTLYGDFGPDPFEMKHWNPNQEGYEAFSIPGNDTLIGGLGRDIMSGGGGHDTFVFNSVLETGQTASTRDVITDFTHGQDIIDLANIDAKSGTAVNDAFTWLGDSRFTGTAGQLHYVVYHGSTIIEGDVNGDRVADFQIELSGKLMLSASDFIL